MKPILSVILVMVATQMATARSTTPADPLIEAAELSGHARSLFEGCDYRGAEHWLRRAKAVIHDGRVREGEADAAGNLSARIDIELTGVRELTKRLDQEQAAITTLIAQGRFAEARTRLQQAAAPACDARFSALWQRLTTAEYRKEHPAHCASCRKAAKVLVWTVIAGGAGYGAYWAYDKYGRPRNATTTARSPVW